MLTIFSWGYWGWGSSTRELVQAVDAAERRRGFRPPLFVDIRYRRAVRAKGFSGNAFRDIVGRQRYVWLQRLGNRRIATGTGGIKIADPPAAKQLLELALTAHKERRRIVFFCACEYPRWCHRAVVARLLLKEADKVGRKVQVVEWPGGTSSSRYLEVDSALFRAVLQGRPRVPLGDHINLGELASQPWGSIFTLKTDARALSIVTGPAKFQNGWYLPVLERGNTTMEMRRSAQMFRKRTGMESHRF